MTLKVGAICRAVNSRSLIVPGSIVEVIEIALMDESAPYDLLYRCRILFGKPIDRLGTRFYDHNGYLPLHSNQLEEIEP
jgi:hypothetical protein